MDVTAPASRPQPTPRTITPTAPAQYLARRSAASQPDPPGDAGRPATGPEPPAAATAAATAVAIQTVLRWPLTTTPPKPATANDSAFHHRDTTQFLAQPSASCLSTSWVAMLSSLLELLRIRLGDDSLPQPQGLQIRRPHRQQRDSQVEQGLLDIAFEVVLGGLVIGILGHLGAVDGLQAALGALALETHIRQALVRMRLRRLIRRCEASE